MQVTVCGHSPARLGAGPWQRCRPERLGWPSRPTLTRVVTAESPRAVVTDGRVETEMEEDQVAEHLGRRVRETSAASQ